MSEVKTYKPTHDMKPGSPFDSMPNYVSLDDYRKLEAELNEWKKKYEVLLDEHKMVRRGIDDVIDNCLESEADDG